MILHPGAIEAAEVRAAAERVAEVGRTSPRLIMIHPAASAGLAGLHTLVCYLAAGGNMRRAARDTAVHVNTLRTRIHRITQIINADLTDPEQRFRLQLAVRLRAGRRAIQEDPSGAPRF